MGVSFEDLRNEALGEDGLKPFVLDLPDGEKVKIKDVPLSLMLAVRKIDSDSVMETGLQFLKLLMGDEQWERVEPFLLEGNFKMLDLLLTKVMDHFHLRVLGPSDE